MSTDQRTLTGDTHDPRHYRQDFNRKGQILWEVGRDCDFDDISDELAEVHRRWVDEGLAARGGE